MATESESIALKSAFNRTSVQLFSDGFRFNLNEAFKRDIDPQKNLGELLVETLKITLQEQIFKGVDIIALYQSGNGDTKNYAQICKQAIELYLEKQK